MNFREKKVTINSITSHHSISFKSYKHCQTTLSLKKKNKIRNLKPTFGIKIFASGVGMVKRNLYMISLVRCDCTTNG